MNMSWYKRKRYIGLMLLFFFPVGAFLSWRYTSWPRTLFVIVGGIILLLSVVIAVIPDPDQKESTEQEMTSAESTAEQDEAQKPASDKEVGTVEPREQAVSQDESLGELDLISTELSGKAIAARLDDSSQCFVEHLVDSIDFPNDKALADNSVSIFVPTAEKVFEDASCRTFVFYFNATGAVDMDRVDRIASYSISRDIYSSYDWQSLVGSPVGIQLAQDDILGIPIALDLEPKDFVY